MDITEITEQAKKVLLAEKQHRPMLFVELQSGELLINFFVDLVQVLDRLPNPVGCSVPYKLSAQVIEMLRDGSGDLVDLLPHNDIAELSNSMLEAFFAGWKLAKFSKTTLRKATKKHRR